MNSWLSALAKSAANAAADRARRAAVMAALWLFAAIFFLVALGFITGSIYTAIANEVGPVSAGFIVAGGFLFLAVILIVAAMIRGRRDQPQTSVDADPLAAAADPNRPASLGTVASSFAYGFARGLSRRRKS
jgi:hypothetical protein